MSEKKKLEEGKSDVPGLTGQFRSSDEREIDAVNRRKRRCTGGCGRPAPHGHEMCHDCLEGANILNRKALDRKNEQLNDRVKWEQLVWAMARTQLMQLDAIVRAGKLEGIDAVVTKEVHADLVEKMKVIDLNLVEKMLPDCDWED